MRHTPKLLAASAAFAATIGLSLYAAGLDEAEIVHFWIAVPAGRVEKPTLVRRAAGPPVRLAPLRIDLDQRGLLKRWLQPAVEGLSTHWIVNVGTRPVRIRMELVEGTVPITWDVNANLGYDPRTHEFTEPLSPGDSIPNLAIDWLFRFPPPAARQTGAGGEPQVLYDGGLRLTDADTGEELTFIPITIRRGCPSEAESPACALCPLGSREP